MSRDLLTSEDDELQLYRHPDGILEIRMNRPEARNALNQNLRDKLFAAYRKFESEDEWNVALLTAAGKVFCAGGDLKEMAENSLTIPGRDFAPWFGINIDVTKPLIAAVQGAALAGGFAMMLNADLVVASESARIGITEAKVGRGAPWSIPMAPQVPQRVMAEMLMTAEPISGARAYDVGLVNRVVPDDDLFDTALQLATTIARNAPLSVRAGKATVRLAHEYNREEAIERAFPLWDHVYLSDDAQEGPASFRAKRRPVWQGR
ncbi:enoyl-CoA hydratase-related protein [Citricoccus sp. NPDC055426]|uniref:enoyl-CoA hydratase/isomerase family protein n=1 Tax=Citricoccus sp. NPDC055426 TaxID=3155536 RepID=UPI00342C86C8